MLMEERQQLIAAQIQTNGLITIAEIVEKYGVSDESARRDLRQLERRGICMRTRGGALIRRQVSVRPPEDRSYETMPVYDNYREIARCAATMIRENDCVYLTGGSLGYLMIPYLPRDIHYTLVVNTVETAQALRTLDLADVYLAGGKMRRSGSMVDSLAVSFVQKMHFDRCFLTGGGLTAEFGLSNGTDETATFQRAVMANSRECVLMMPSGKIGRDDFIKVCDAERFQRIITDWDVLEEHAQALQDRGCEVIMVEKQSES